MRATRDLFTQCGRMLAGYLLVWFAPNSNQIVGVVPGDHGKPKSPEAVPGRFLPIGMTARWGLVSGLIAVIALLGMGAKSEFLYFQF